MMKQTIKYILIVAILSFILPACSKKKGCTDKTAANFNSEAEENCCCEYNKGQVVFWFNKAWSDPRKASGFTSIQVRIDGELIGSSDINSYRTTAPECGDPQSMTGTINLGSAKSKQFLYVVYDQKGQQQNSGYVIIDANLCTKLQL